MTLLPNQRRRWPRLGTYGSQVLQALEVAGRLGVSKKSIRQWECEYLRLGDGQAIRSLNRCGYERLAGEDGSALGRPHVCHYLIHGTGWLKQQADAIETVDGPTECKEVNLKQY